MKKFFIGILLLVLIAAIVVVTHKKPEPPSQFSLDLNCNLTKPSAAFAKACQTYTDSALLKKECSDGTGDEERCAAYTCAERLNAGDTSCE